MRIDGCTVVLTGATGGLGQAIARELHARGGRLTLTGRRADVLEPLARELGAETSRTAPPWTSSLTGSAAPTSSSPTPASPEPAGSTS